jgi:hypothetical protein
MLFLILQRNKTFPEHTKPLILFSEYMGINDLKLSDAVVAALYRETLVGSDGPAPPEKAVISALPVETVDTRLPFLGKNLRSICFLVSYPDDEFIPEEQLSFLLKILQACKCGLDDIALINTKNFPVEINNLKSRLNPGSYFYGETPIVTGIDQEFPDMTISTWKSISLVPVRQVELMSRNNPEVLR